MNDLLVLIVDDDCDIHFILKRLFQKMGIKTIHSEFLKDAKSKILAQPSFILLDNHLPDGLGIDLVPQIKILAPNAIIIAMTAFICKKIEYDAFEKGVDYFIEKPFSSEQIQNLLGHALQLGKLRNHIK